MAIIISFLILIGYQYLFVDFEQVPQDVVQTEENGSQEQKQPPMIQPETEQVEQPALPVDGRPALDINIETELYKAVISERGGAVKSFVLKKYRESSAKDSPGKQLIQTDDAVGFPLKFGWGDLFLPDTLYDSSKQQISLVQGAEKDSLVLGSSGSGLEVERTYVFFKDKYYIDMTVKVKNTSSNPLQGAAKVYQVNLPFQSASTSASRFLFTGPAAYINDTYHQIKDDEFQEAAKTMHGNMSWAGYQGTYFTCSVAPLVTENISFTMKGKEKLVWTTIGSGLDTLKPGEEKAYSYRIYYGPKKLKLLKEAGDNLAKAVNFGWFDVIAKPTLWLLNLFYKVVHNYGIAIIMITILFKAVFWPITHKGMKSMKNMQKLQPKMVKIKEKYKDDPAQMNREMMNLYKTYKVNPLGGCLPMLLQIPVFFALYKVLLQSIELRHAPFMLWITDLSAPDRLMVGVDIPILGGIPVLTLLMGASMFVQQKLTPTTADPAQQRIMLILPVIFTFMFLNFASGLVLYWFVNNLLAILQQQMINRSSGTAA